MFLLVYFVTVQYNFRADSSPVVSSSPDFIKRQLQCSWGKMSVFSQSVWISLTLNTTLHYSQKFYTDKSDNNDFILHGVWTGPFGKIGNSGNIKFLKIRINPTSTVLRTSKNSYMYAKRCVFDLCFFKTLFLSVFLLIFETMQLHTNNLVNEFKSQTFVHTVSAYTYRVELVGY